MDRTLRLRAVAVAAVLALDGCTGLGSGVAPDPDARPAARAASSAPSTLVPAPDDRPLSAERTYPGGGADGRAGPVRGDDADEDGVADADDECPTTRRDEIVDAAGCARFTRALDGVVFAPGDHLLDADARRALAGLVADLEAYPNVVVRLAGHTDNRGTAAANLELSKRRVMSVARFLVARGIAPERLRPYGYGESRPRAGNGSLQGRERNRRIEIEREPQSPANARLPTLAEPDAPRQNDANPGNRS